VNGEGNKKTRRSEEEKRWKGFGKMRDARLKFVGLTMVEKVEHLREQEKGIARWKRGRGVSGWNIEL